MLDHLALKHLMKSVRPGSTRLETKRLSALGVVVPNGVGDVQEEEGSQALAGCRDRIDHPIYRGDACGLGDVPIDCLHILVQCCGADPDIHGSDSI